jgi:hypothetical protein
MDSCGNSLVLRFANEWGCAMKRVIILLLLFPAIAFAGDCENQGGKCVPLSNDLLCPSGGNGVQGLGCEPDAMCCKSNDKCCILKEFQECFDADTPKKVASCKGRIIDCVCSPNCTARCVENEKCCSHGNNLSEIPYGITEEDCIKNGWTVNPISCEKLEQRLTRKCCVTDRTCMSIPNRISEEECLSQGWSVIYCRFSDNCKR